MESIQTAQSLGFTFPSPAYLFGAILFGIIGFAAYRYGKKSARPSTLWLGVALMLYPYFISQTWMLYGVGVALCASIYFWHH